MDEVRALVDRHYPLLSDDLREEIAMRATLKEFPAGTEILREGGHVKVVPLVIRGLIKVQSRYEDKELLLYYIHPGESCIMSFLAGLKSLPSRIYAVTEDDTTALLLPAQTLSDWIQRHPSLNTLFFELYDHRYADLLDTIQHLIFHRLDQRILDYLIEQQRIRRTNRLNIRHREIASDLGTAREVITRTLKKLEKEGKISQNGLEIEILVKPPNG